MSNAVSTQTAQFLRMSDVLGGGGQDACINFQGVADRLAVSAGKGRDLDAHRRNE